MKEQIYTIPVNEIYDKDCECPLCELEKRIEKECIDYALGAAMMEPDYRIESNELGYCNKHYEKMFEQPNKLSLALVLDTHMMEVRKKLAEHTKTITNLKNQKSGLFRKTGAKELSKKLYEASKKITCDCLICKKVNFTMDRYTDVILYMWSTNDEFKMKFDKSNGFCLKHFGDVCKMIPKAMSDSEAAKFLPCLFKKESKLLDALQEDIHKFTLKFDYRNKDMPWGTAQNSPIRSINTLSGTINPHINNQDK